MQYSINEPFVIFERFEEEVVAVQLESGAYYSMSSVAADVFQLLAARPHQEQIARALAQKYDASAEAIHGDLTAFLGELRQHALVVAQNGHSNGNGSPVALPSVTERLPYSRPAVAAYTDLEALFLLDPVHDVDAQGWPAPKPGSTSTSLTGRYRIPSSGVIFERFDDETVAMNLATGSYHSLSAAAEDIYLLLADEPTGEELLHALKAKYDSAPDMEHEVEHLLSQLQTFGLVETTEAETGKAPRTLTLAKPGNGVPWQTPKLDLFLDQAPATAAAFLGYAPGESGVPSETRRYRFAAEPVLSIGCQGGGLAVCAGQGTYFRLSSSAVVAFELLRYAPTTAELVRALCERFDAAPQTITAAAVVLLRHLQVVGCATAEPASVSSGAALPKYDGPKMPFEAFSLDMYRDLRELFVYHESPAPAPSGKRRVREMTAALADYFAAGSGKVGESMFSFRTAGRCVHVHCAGPQLSVELKRAFAHLPAADSGGASDLTVYVCDATAAGMSQRPLLAGVLSRLQANWALLCGQRGEVQGFHGDDLSMLYHPGPGILSVYEPGERKAWFVHNLITPLPYWEVGSPFRAILQQWLSDCGQQFVHAAAVGLNGRGLLLAGKGGSGKSTTSLVCLENGWQYAGDDYTVVDGDVAQFRVHSLYNTAKLKGASDVANFPRLAGAAWKNAHAQAGDKATFFLEEVWPNQMVGELSVEAILVPRITGQPQTSTSLCLPADALLALAPSTVAQLPCAGERDLRRMAALVEQVPCHYLYLGTDLKGIAPVMQSLLDGNRL